MPIKFYEVVEPPTSAELEAMALEVMQEQDTALKGLLNVVLRSQDEPDNGSEPLQMSIRRTEFDKFGQMSTILGPGTLNAGTEAGTHSDSVRLKLSTDNGSEPALASLVL